MIQVYYVRLYLGIETVFYRLLQWMARMDMDWDLKKLDQRFEPFILRLQNIHLPKKKITMVSASW